MAKVEIVDFVAPVEENPYGALIEALVTAGEGKSARVTVTRKELAKTKRQVREAANAENYTARLRNTTDDADEDKQTDDDTIVLEYTLGPKQHRPGRAGNPTADEAPAKGKK